MKVLNSPARIIIAVVFLVTAVVLSNDICAQTDELTPVYQVRDVEELGLIGSTLWVAQWYFVPKALANMVPLYGYNLQTACDNIDQENRENFGQAAIVGSWNTLNSNRGQNVATSAGLGVLFYEDVSMAIEQLRNHFDVTCDFQPTNSDQGPFVATTLPIPQVDPARRFLVTVE